MVSYKANEDDRLLARKVNLRKALKDVPLGEFTANELEAVIRLFCRFFDSQGTLLEPGEEHLKILEKKAKMLKKNKKEFEE